MNYNKGLDSTQDWGGMISISKQSEKNPQDKEQSENTTSKSTKSSASELQKILNNLNLNKTKKNTSAEKSSAPQTKTPAQQKKTKIRTINIPGKKISAPQSTIDTTPAQTKEPANVPDSTKVVNVEPTPVGPGPNIPDITDTPVQTVEPTPQPIVEQIDDIKTKTTYPNGNYSVQTDNSIVLYDKDGNELISYWNYSPVLSELNNFNCDGEKISVTFENNKIDLIKGDKVVKHYSIIVENNINNTVKVYDTDGSLKSQSSIPPGKKGAVKYVADLLGINIDITDCDIEYDENGRVTYFHSNRISNAMHMVGGGINHSAEISYNDETNEMTINYDYFESHGMPTLVYSSTLTYDANGKLINEVKNIKIDNTIKK